jgi:hypothetical protein
VHQGCQFQIDFRVGLGEPPEPADQPLGRKVR